MELVITGNLLDGAFAIALKQHKVANVIQKQRPVEKAPHQRFQLPFQHWPVSFIPDGAPGHKPLLVSGQGTHPGGITITDHQRLIKNKQVADFILVGLQLVKGIPDIHILITGAFQLQHRKGDAINKADNIRAAGIFGSRQCELVYHHKAVIGHRCKIYQKGMVVYPLLIVAFVVHRHTVQQQLVEVAVIGDQVQAFGLGQRCPNLLKAARR